MKQIRMYGHNALVFVIVLFLTSCGGGGGGGGSPVPVPAGILEGATQFTGEYPDAGPVTYTDWNGVMQTVMAVPGQVQVFFTSSTKESDAVAVIGSANGTVLGSIPAIGYYLAQVAVGAEGAFISAVLADIRVNDAIPNGIFSPSQGGVVINDNYVTSDKPVPLNVHGPVLIDAGAHADQVLTSAENHGGTFTDYIDFGLATHTENGYSWIAADKVQTILAAVAQGSALYNPGSITLVNLSANGGYKDVNGDWADYTTLNAQQQAEARFSWMLCTVGVLMALEALPPDLRSSVALTMSAGNNNMPIQPMLDTIRLRPEFAAILDGNMSIATTPLSNYNQANQAADGDPSVIVMTNSEAASGTSFAAPVANAFLQYLTLAALEDIRNLTGVSLAVINKATELAVNANANSDAVIDEIVGRVEAIQQAESSDPPEAYAVESIGFTSVGGNSCAAISPPYANVSVQYSVSGTDGYYDSGTLPTSGSGSVCFGIPSGEPGVTDTISATAVLSGRQASTKFTW